MVQKARDAKDYNVKFLMFLRLNHAAWSMQQNFGQNFESLLKVLSQDFRVLLTPKIPSLLSA